MSYRPLPVLTHNIGTPSGVSTPSERRYGQSQVQEPLDVTDDVGLGGVEVVARVL